MATNECQIGYSNNESESGFESGAKKAGGYIPAAVHQTTATTSQPHLVTHAQEARGGVQVALRKLSRLRDSKLLSAAGKKTTVVGRGDGATRSVSGRTPKREGRAFRTEQVAPLLYGEKTTYRNKGAWKKSGRASERASADSREQSKETTQAN